MMDVVQVLFLLNLSEKALLILEWFRFSVIRMLDLIEILCCFSCLKSENLCSDRTIPRWIFVAQAITPWSIAPQNNSHLG